MSLYRHMRGGGHGYLLRIGLHLHQPGIGSDISKGIFINEGGGSGSVVAGKKSDDG